MYLSVFYVQFLLRKIYMRCYGPQHFTNRNKTFNFITALSIQYANATVFYLPAFQQSFLVREALLAKVKFMGEGLTRKLDLEK